MIVVTGAAGFIGSYLVGKLNKAGYNDLILVDKFDDPWKDLNLLHKKYLKFIDQNPGQSNDEEPLEEKDKHGNLNRNEYRDTIMPGWRAFKSMANGIY